MFFLVSIKRRYFDFFKNQSEYNCITQISFIFNIYFNELHTCRKTITNVIFVIIITKLLFFGRNDFVDDKGCVQQASNMHGMYITMMKKLQVSKKSKAT